MIVEFQLLIVGVQQLDDILSIVNAYFLAWFNIFGIRTKDAITERRKVGAL
jgi:hypothetical protein